MKNSNPIIYGQFSLVARPVVGSRLRVLLNVLNHDELKSRMVKALEKSAIYVNDHCLLASELEQHESAFEVKLMQLKYGDRSDE